MEFIEFSWISEGPTFKEALQQTLGSSGQLIKKYYSSKEQSAPVQARRVYRLPVTLVNHLKINPTYVGPEVKILRETPDYIVLHKPYGVHCHPLSYSDQDTLLNFLVTAGKWESLLVNQEHYDRGLLYRLDHDTSGVMVLAKNEKALKSIRDSFSTAMKRKFYWAIVEGDFDKDGLWSHHFKATGQKGAKQKVSEWPEPSTQEATLSVMKIMHQEGKSLLLVNLKTGIRHQIRAQLAALGFPILGDELYGGKKAERLFLHALRYEFVEIAEDQNAELFDRFFDLDRALQVGHDVLGRF